MSHVSFYRKWRPQVFEDIIGQQRVTRTLQNAIRTKRVVHAYLFAGHRGTGKTTTARIFAKALNCLSSPDPVPEPCNVCANCEAISGGFSVDVIEIDAASNRRIEEIRDIRDRVHFAPTQGRYKVYILDEAHMLTPEAANALLKTLEEPPEQAVFVLVTTEPHKLPATILSRCQRYDFRRVSLGEIMDRLQRIAGGEGFVIDRDALELIAMSADGSVRDAESVLDQLASFAEGPITRDDVLAVLGTIEEEAAIRFADAVISRDVAAGLSLINQFVAEGKDMRQVLRAMIDHFRNLLVAKTTGSPAEILDIPERRGEALRAQAEPVPLSDILRALQVLSESDVEAREARLSVPVRFLLEIAFVRLCRPEMDPSLAGLSARLQALEQRMGMAAASPPSGAPAPPAEAPAPADRPHGAASSTRRTAPAPVEPAGQSAQPAPPTNGEVKAAVSIDDVRNQWARILEQLKRTKMFCHALLIEGIPLRVEGSTLIVGLRTGYNFHIENLHKPENRSVVEAALEQVLLTRLRLQCTIHDAAPEPAADADPLVAKALELFGGQVVDIRNAD
ncbi:MAG TPA: DNA polymerase III subunit gamma/tau [bacterium]|jgi:DNA polymerase-3 subunit gamma/tau|nr:DNA polymerase III subunit gamma/tau [bacterium]